MGHGIGRDLHEPPQVPNHYSKRFEREDDFPLRPGLVLAIEPMVNAGAPEVTCLEDGWTQVSLDGGWSAHFEHTVALIGAWAPVVDGPARGLKWDVKWAWSERGESGVGAGAASGPGNTGPGRWQRALKAAPAKSYTESFHLTQESR